MPNLNQRQQLAVGVVLAAFMAFTRSHHFAGLHHLPDASWAVFFLAGLYLRPAWTFPALCVLAATSDTIAISWGGVSSFCVSPAYAMLLPAYGALWMAGRWYAGRHSDSATTLLPLVLAVSAGSVTCELLSSASFYFFSGRYIDPSLTEFIPRLVKYFPHALSSLALYIGAAAIVHAALAAVNGRSAQARG
jgi:hypothetical protein